MGRTNCVKRWCSRELPARERPLGDEPWSHPSVRYRAPTGAGLPSTAAGAQAALDRDPGDRPHRASTRGFDVFEAREPGRQAWREWTRADSYQPVGVSASARCKPGRRSRTCSCRSSPFATPSGFEDDGSDLDAALPHSTAGRGSLERAGSARWTFATPRTGRDGRSCSSPSEPAEGSAAPYRDEPMSLPLAGRLTP